MTDELFENEEDKVIAADEEAVEVEEVVVEPRQRHGADARRRLENMLEEKRLRDELEDFLDY
jgi:hypothetical protein